jgi:hypothetical protein
LCNRTSGVMPGRLSTALPELSVSQRAARGNCPCRFDLAKKHCPSNRGVTSIGYAVGPAEGTLNTSPSINKNPAAAILHLRPPRDHVTHFSVTFVSGLSVLCVKSSFSFLRSTSTVTFVPVPYPFTSLLPYFASSSRKHSSSVFTANSACSSSITNGGQNRTVVSPDPRISNPL